MLCVFNAIDEKRWVDEGASVRFNHCVVLENDACSGPYPVTDLIQLFLCANDVRVEREK